MPDKRCVKFFYDFEGGGKWDMKNVKIRTNKKLFR